MAIFTRYILPGLIAAIVSVLICIINNRYISKIENEKQTDRIRTFRYQTLYGFLQTSIGTPEELLDPDSARNLINRSPEKRFQFDRNQYFKIRTLLDESYRAQLDPLFIQCHESLDRYLQLEDGIDDPATPEEEIAQYRYCRNKFIREATVINEKLQAVIQQQIIDLL